MNDFVRNICWASFMPAVTTCYQVHARNTNTHTYLRRGFVSLGVTGRLVPKTRCG